MIQITFVGWRARFAARSVAIAQALVGARRPKHVFGALRVARRDGHTFGVRCRVTNSIDRCQDLETRQLIAGFRTSIGIG